MDHPRALGHAADAEALRVYGRFLRAGVGGEDRLRRVGAADGRELRHRLLEPGEHALDRQRHPDHAGRQDEHLLGRQPEQVRSTFRGRTRVG